MIRESQAIKLSFSTELKKVRGNKEISNVVRENHSVMMTLVREKMIVA